MRYYLTCGGKSHFNFDCPIHKEDSKKITKGKGE